MDAALYSEALEQQLALGRRLGHPEGRRVLADLVCSMGGDANMAQAILTPLLYALAAGEPYYWSPSTCALVAHGGAVLPDTWVLTPDTVSARSGFFWFADGLPLHTPGYWDGAAPVRAMAWTGLDDMDNGDGTSGEMMLVHSREPVLPDKLRIAFFVEGDRALTPVTFVDWAIGDSLATTLTAVDVAARYRYERDGGANWPGAPNPRLLAKLRYFGAALAFLQQEITVAPRQAALRACRRRLARDGWEHIPLIRVVELRRRRGDVSGASGPGAPVDWHCQWVVSGHWRQQPCGPGRVERRTRWVLPHLKGPEGKPLKPPSTKVFAVIR